MNEYIDGCYKLQGNLTGPIVKSPCGLNPGDNEYVAYCSVAGSVSNRANEIISVERTINEINPDNAWFVVTWLDGNGVERSNTNSPLGTDKNTTFSIYVADSNDCELSHTPTDSDSEISPGCPSLPYNPTWLSNPCPKLSVPIGVELNCPELPGAPEPGVLPPSTTNDTRWCVAVIDEDSAQSFSLNSTQWDNFRANYPDRVHFVLEASRQNTTNDCSSRSMVVTPKTTVGIRSSSLYVPDNYKAELDTVYANWIPVNRDLGGSCVDDWYTLIGAEVLTANAKLALFVDNSGSMTTSTIQASYNLFVSKLSARNIDFFVVENSSENWIGTFDSDFI